MLCGALETCELRKNTEERKRLWTIGKKFANLLSVLCLLLLDQRDTYQPKPTHIEKSMAELAFLRIEWNLVIYTRQVIMIPATIKILRESMKINPLEKCFLTKGYYPEQLNSFSVLPVGILSYVVHFPRGSIFPLYISTLFRHMQTIIYFRVYFSF